MKRGHRGRGPEVEPHRAQALESTEKGEGIPKPKRHRRMPRHDALVTREGQLVIHDDVDLEPGRLKVKVGGGDGGHKGVRSTTEVLGEADFVRIRCGVGRPEVGEVTDHVLRDFAEEERELLEEEIKRAAGAVTTVMRRGLRDAMNKYNRLPAAEKKESTREGGAETERETRPNEEAATGETST